MDVAETVQFQFQDSAVRDALTTPRSPLLTHGRSMALGGGVGGGMGVTFDDVLTSVGGMGVFQWSLFLVFSLVSGWSVESIYANFFGQ